MSAYRVVTIQHDGLTYTPVVDRAGRVLNVGQLARLASVPCAAPGRTVDFVLLDESAPSSGQPPLRLAHVGCREFLPLELGDSGLAVGRVELVESRPAHATTGTVGRHLAARARLQSTLLADVIWTGILAGHLRGVCAVLLDWDERAAECRTPSEPNLEVLAVRLGALEDSCLTNASIRAWREDPSDRAPADLVSLPARDTSPASVRVVSAGDVSRSRP